MFTYKHGHIVLNIIFIRQFETKVETDIIIHFYSLLFYSFQLHSVEKIERGVCNFSNINVAIMVISSCNNLL